MIAITSRNALCASPASSIRWPLYTIPCSSRRIISLGVPFSVRLKVMVFVFGVGLGWLFGIGCAVGMLFLS